MKSRIAFVVCVLLIVGWASSALTSETPPASWPAPAATTVAEVPVTATVSESITAERRLKWRERRAMGLTIKNVRRILKEMDAQGELEGKDSSVLAVEVLTQLVEEKPQAFQELRAGDWEDFFDMVLAWLEKLIPLIILLINLFS